MLGPWSCAQVKTIERMPRHDSDGSMESLTKQFHIQPFRLFLSVGTSEQHFNSYLGIEASQNRNAVVHLYSLSFFHSLWQTLIKRLPSSFFFPAPTFSSSCAYVLQFQGFLIIFIPFQENPRHWPASALAWAFVSLVDG